MARSYTQLRNTYGVDTKNTSSANLTQGDEWMNDFHRRLLAKADWPFLLRLRTALTFAPNSVMTAATSDIITATTNNILADTGTEVTFTTTDTLPAGLSTGTKYYIIHQTATTFKVALSKAAAFAGTVVDITDTGTGTHTVVVNDRFQPLPHDIDQIQTMFITVASTRYTVKPSPSRQHWDELHYTNQQNDIPIYFFVQDDKFAVWPRPSSADNVITMNGKVRTNDLSIADFTTGNIDIVTNGSVKITGAGTPGWSVAQAIAGKWIKITHTNTAASSGDGMWYEIASVESSTVLTIVRPYGGRSLTTGASGAYIIGQMPLLPEAIHDIIEQYAAWRYWTKENDVQRALSFKEMLNDGLNTLQSAYSVNDTSMVLDDGTGDFIINPNLVIQL